MWLICLQEWYWEMSCLFSCKRTKRISFAVLKIDFVMFWDETSFAYGSLTDCNSARFHPCFSALPTSAFNSKSTAEKFHEKPFSLSFQGNFYLMKPSAHVLCFVGGSKMLKASYNYTFFHSVHSQDDKWREKWHTNPYVCVLNSQTNAKKTYYKKV